MKLMFKSGASSSRTYLKGLFVTTAVALLSLSGCKKANDTSAQPGGADGFKVDIDHAPKMPGAPETGPDLISVDYDNADVLIKTDYAEVVYLLIPEGEAVPAHVGGNRVILSLNDYGISFLELGETKIKRFKAGDVHFHSAGRHVITNIGETPAEFVIFERLSKGTVPPGEPSGADDTPKPGVAASERKLFSNDAFDVFEVTIEPGGNLSPHQGFSRAVYSMGDYDVDFYEGGKKTSRSFTSGQVHFHNPGKHWLKNTGKTQARFVVVDYKK